ncbi:hypothetical protein C8R43DRAFT_1121092 [Mycena crocata]|nr:hypothetical protein C8R43DRAFT_1121092 [Mycena crocata]
MNTQIFTGSCQFPTWGTQPGRRPALPPPSSFHSSPNSDSPLRMMVFNSLDGTALNSSLIGCDNRAYFHITTRSFSPERTLVQDSRDARVGLITWDTEVTVSIDEQGWTKRVSEWLYSGAGRAGRTMEVDGESFIWQPNGWGVELFSTDPHPQIMARLSPDLSGTILQLAPLAIEPRFINPIIVSAILFMSGRNIQ